MANNKRSFINASIYFHLFVANYYKQNLKREQVSVYSFERLSLDSFSVTPHFRFFQCNDSV